MTNQNFDNPSVAGTMMNGESLLRWKDAATLMATLDVIGREGANVVVKIDGGRLHAPYTVVLSGPKLGDSLFRKDGAEVQTLLKEAIEFYSSTQKR